MRVKHWFECWGGPILVVAIILVGTLVATLLLRELRPCGLLDVALRGDGCLCETVNVVEPPLETSGFIP